MHKHSDQIPFTLPVEGGNAREDLIESPANFTAVEMIDAWPDWPGNVAILAGPVGSGKTHLASIWSGQADAEIFKMKNLRTEHALTGEARNFVLENADANGIDETALFHLINQTRANGGYLLITSRTWPKAWNITLPDLSSRLRGAFLVELYEPDDTLLALVIHKLFADRQLEIDPAVVDYLVVRMERSLGIAGEIVEKLDHEALARNSKITKALASRVLQEMSSD
ncbi:MAG: hypothetical protein JKY82_12000 [Rhizobiaceae bacterium]|nr:hypothetical protein [Rhizobiaceae bacterium]MBL4733294.1 hypothetical protein [Rhizobiaceae bacterium]